MGFIPERLLMMMMMIHSIIPIECLSLRRAHLFFQASVMPSFSWPHTLYTMPGRVLALIQASHPPHVNIPHLPPTLPWSCRVHLGHPSGPRHAASPPGRHVPCRAAALTRPSSLLPPPPHAGIFSALAAHLHHTQHGKSVRFVPLTVYAPKVTDLGVLQVYGGRLNGFRLQGLMGV